MGKENQRIALCMGALVSGQLVANAGLHYLYKSRQYAAYAKNINPDQRGQQLQQLKKEDKHNYGWRPLIKKMRQI